MPSQFGDGMIGGPWEVNAGIEYRPVCVVEIGGDPWRGIGMGGIESVGTVPRGLRSNCIELD